MSCVVGVRTLYGVPAGLFWPASICGFKKSIVAAEKASAMPVLPIKYPVLVMIHPSGRGLMIDTSSSLFAMRTRVLGLLAVNFEASEPPAGVRETGTLASGHSGRKKST